MTLWQTAGRSRSRTVGRGQWSNGLGLETADQQKKEFSVGLFKQDRTQ